MQFQGGKENRKRRLRRLFTSRPFLIWAVCVCAALMLASIFSIARSLRMLRALSAAELAAPAGELQTLDPYFVPTPEPTPTPAPTPTPTPTPESPYGWKHRADGRVYLRPDGSALTGLHLLDGRLYYFDLTGRCADALGVDVSYHNLGINWDAVRAQGIEFAVVRLGYRGWETGLLHEDTRFLQNLRGAKRAGLKVGVYLYSTAVNAAEAEEEASRVLGALNGFPLDLPVYFDTEQSGEYPNGRADRLGKARRYEVITGFCRVIEAGGYRAGVYSGQNFFKNHVAFRTLSPYAIWLASYTARNRLPDFPYDYGMWQFTDRAVVSGIRGVADLNAVFGPLP